MSDRAFRQTLFAGIRYRDAQSAIAWLERAFGAKRNVVYDAPDGTVAHAQLEIAGNLFMLGEDRDDGYAVHTPASVGGVTGSIYVALPDRTSIDELFERAGAAGATIVKPPYETDYGSYEVALTDVGGHHWSFGTYDPSEVREAPSA